MKAAACFGLTWPEGRGRPRVRATCASSLRSTMSLKVEPAPRITIAPTRKSRQCQRLGNGSPAAIAASHREEPPLDITVKADPARWAEALGGIALPTGSVRLRERQAIIELGRLAERSPEALADEAIDGVLSGLGWKPEAPSGQGRQRERWESLTALRTMALDEGEGRDEWSASEASAWLQERASWQASPVASAVTLATLHAAKGLEWDGVAIVGVREGMIPFVLSQEEPALSEERRLLYVGFTRAKRALRVSWSASRGSATRSRFIADQVTGPATVGKPPAPRTSSRSRVCRVCGNRLESAAERKLSRHLSCEVDYDEALFERLRAWRKATADDAKVPAFVVFTDATLQAIAEAVPRDEAALLRLPGIGQAKVSKYGPSVLAVVADLPA